MKKLKAIWDLILSDNFAVFTYRNSSEDLTIMTADRFGWGCKKYNSYFWNLIRLRLNKIEDYYNK